MSFPCLCPALIYRVRPRMLPLASVPHVSAVILVLCLWGDLCLKLRALQMWSATTDQGERGYSSRHNCSLSSSFVIPSIQLPVPAIIIAIALAQPQLHRVQCHCARQIEPSRDVPSTLATLTGPPLSRMIAGS